MRWLPLLILLIGLVVLLAAGDAGTIAGFETDTLAPMIAMLALLVFLMTSMLSRLGGRYGEAIRDLTVWMGIALILVAGYSFRQEFTEIASRITGELTPPGEAVAVEGRTAGERAVRLRRRGDGHFLVLAQVDGTRVPMLVDTGASTIVLKPADAQALGIDTSRLSFTVPVQTANGTAYAAAVRLRRVAVGPIELQGLDALVTAPGALRESLLGLNFLRRLRSYEFSGDYLTLRG